MYAITRILVTTDFSDYSAAALEYALSLADVHNADVHLLHVVDGSMKSLKHPEESCHRTMRKFIFEKVDEFQNITQAIRTGIPHVEIIRYAKDHEINLIVIATHGLTGWRRVVKTVGEKIGKTGMTYSQGMSAQVTAATAIGIASITGMPVSTTHVLSSAVAGTMVANKSGLQFSTIKTILMAWVLTLPTTIILAGGLFYAGVKLFM